MTTEAATTTAGATLRIGMVDAEVTGAIGAMAHPAPQLRAVIAGPAPCDFARWQQHLDVQQ